MILAVLLFLAAATPESVVHGLLDRQAADWNRGDIEAFMQAYERSPDTAFVGKDGVRKGWDTILARYRAAYATREKMGTLRFTDVEVRLLDPDHALVTGKYSLERAASAGGPASGWYSLVLVRKAGEWKIVLDHTSAS